MRRERPGEAKREEGPGKASLNRHARTSAGLALDRTASPWIGVRAARGKTGGGRRQKPVAKSGQVVHYLAL
jgi:hypothetical protein